MSLLGKINALTERAQDFTQRTSDVFDGIAAKIAEAEKKRDAAELKHTSYYDALSQGLDDTITAIDRLSNSPLGER